MRTHETTRRKEPDLEATRPGRHLPLLAPATAALLAFGAGACNQQLTETQRAMDPGIPALAKPPSCGDQVPLSITINDGLAGAGLTSDGQGPYVEGQDNVGAHLNGPTGNLMLWTSQYGATNRYVNVAWTDTLGNPVTKQTTDRIYTNNHTDASGTSQPCGFKSLGPGTTGKAAFEVETDGSGIVRYGKFCDGSLEPLADRPATSRSAVGDTLTITGDGGLLCKKLGHGRNATWVVLGTAGPFELTMVQQ